MLNKRFCNFYSNDRRISSTTKREIRHFCHLIYGKKLLENVYLIDPLINEWNCSYLCFFKWNNRRFTFMNKILLAKTNERFTYNFGVEDKFISLWAINLFESIIIIWWIICAMISLWWLLYLNYFSFYKLIQHLAYNKIKKFKIKMRFTWLLSILNDILIFIFFPIQIERK